VNLRLGDRAMELRPGRPLLMGIVNVTPDSFSDPGELPTLEVQVERGLALRGEGADLIDVGGESGVTNAPSVEPEEEIRRVVPVIERLAAAGVTVSVDTHKPEVAAPAIAAGAVLVNDVSGLREPELAGVCAERGAGLVVVHTRAAPKEKAFPAYDDVMADVVAFLGERVALARERGVEEERIVVDPGPDLAKTPAETIEVLRRLPELAALGRPVLLAVSRKDFVGALTGRPPAGRLGGTLAALEVGVAGGASLVRVHDVAAAADYLAVRAALRGEQAVPEDLALPEGLRRQA
jgi:dihydropteroate synthase